jgi:hypothetical protein
MLLLILARGTQITLARIHSGHEEYLRTIGTGTLDLRGQYGLTVLLDRIMVILVIMAGGIMIPG